MVVEKKQIGLLFGSFNPIHIGHVLIADYIQTVQKFDEVWLVVSPQNPFKEQNLLIDSKHRLNMVKLAIENYPKLVAKDVELNMPTPSYTIDTLRLLRNLFSDTKFQIIMGSDNLESFLRWKEVDEIIANHQLVVYPRLNYNNTIPDLLTSHVTISNAPIIELSSTLLRKQLMENTIVCSFYPSNVLEYIEQNKLFR